MARRSGPSQLEAAVQQWVEATLSSLPGIINHPIPGIPDLPARAVLTTGMVEAVLQVGKHLSKIGHFRDPAVLSGFLFDSLAIILRLDSSPEQLDIADIAAQLIQRLANPSRQFRFSAPLTLRGALAWSADIGGPNELNIKSAERDDQVTMNVSGVIDAPTEVAAVTDVEDIFETLLGSCSGSRSLFPPFASARL